MKRALLFFVIVAVTFVTIQSCKHYPPDLIPTPDGNDTTGDTTHTPKHPCSPDTVYYERDIQPLFNAYCIGSGCHNPPSPKEDLDLTSYTQAMASGKIKPFSASNSKVYKSIAGLGGDPMPPTGSMPADKIALIQKWINQGAKNLLCDDILGPCDTTNVTYSKTIVPILTANCAGCHGVSGGVTLTNYNGVKTVINNGKLWLAINHLPGAVAMPGATVSISKCNIRKIKKWIDAGAPNN